MSINHKTFEAIYNWINHKSLKNFCILYRDGFLFNHLWSRPLWRCWRIFRNTCLNNRYNEIKIISGVLTFVLYYGIIYIEIKKGGR